MLFARALVSFLVLPGVVAGLIPWLIVSANRFEPTNGWFWPGLGVLSTGLAILLWCVRDFYVTGKGTLAPWDPPLALIVIFHLRVVFFEEAWLAKSFPAEWNAYRAAVPRWLPRISTGTRAERRDGER